MRKPLFDKECLIDDDDDMKWSPEIGDFVEVRIVKSTRSSLYGEALSD